MVEVLEKIMSSASSTLVQDSRTHNFSFGCGNNVYIVNIKT